jgi:hypothetical protein
VQSLPSAGVAKSGDMNLADMLRALTLRAGLLIVVMMASCLRAEAVTYYAFDFTYQMPGVSVVGTLMTTLQSTGKYLIATGVAGVTAITGTRNGVAMTGVTVTGVDQSNNIIYSPAAPGIVDLGGFTYTTSTGTYNFYYSGGQYREDTLNGSTTSAIATSTLTQPTGSTQPTLSSPRLAPGPLPGAGLLSYVLFGLAGLAARARLLWSKAKAALDRVRRSKVPTTENGDRPKTIEANSRLGNG